MLPIPPAPAKRSGSRYTLHIVSLQVAQHFNLRPQCTMRACLSARENSMSKKDDDYACVKSERAFWIILQLVYKYNVFERIVC